MSTVLRTSTIAAMSAAFLIGVTTGVSGAAQQEEATTRIFCEQARADADPFYDGASASKAYDNRFRPGPNLSGAELDAFTPQGATWLEDYDGGKDILLATTYNNDASVAHIVGLDPDKPGENATIGTVRIDKSHVGAIAVHGDWVFVSGPKQDGGKQHTIQKYKVSDVKKGIREGKPGTPTKPRIEPVGPDRKVHGSSYLTVSGDHLYSGLFAKHQEKMYRYAIGADGSLTTTDGPWETPAYTQGVMVQGDEFVYSTSSGRDKRSNLYSVNAGQKDLDEASPRCFRAPSMSQQITKDPQGNAHLLFESGSHQYDGTEGERAINVIKGFHTAELAALIDLEGGKIALGTLHCVETEDYIGDDDVYLRVEGEEVFDGKMNDGDEQKVGGEPIQFTGRVKVSLHEKDVEGDDLLGEHLLEPGRDEGILEFSKDGAKYRLSYKTA